MYYDTKGIIRQGTTPVCEKPRNIAVRTWIKWKPKNLKEKRRENRMRTKWKKHSMVTVKVNYASARQGTMARYQSFFDTLERMNDTDR